MTQIKTRAINRIKGLVQSTTFRRLQHQIHPETKRRHAEIVNWACSQSPDQEQFLSDDTLAQRGQELRARVLASFNFKYKGRQDLRFLVHLPRPEESPAGYSIFANLISTFRYMGIECEALNTSPEATEKQLRSFQPTVLMISDSIPFLKQVNWDAVARYKANSALRIGLTASIAAYGNSPLSSRLDWAKKHSVDFYFSFRAPEYYRMRPDYRPFFEQGYRIVSLEFSANPLIYYPIGGIERDIDYIFLGSSNADKQLRYWRWFRRIFKERSGFINGPGWTNMNSRILLEKNRRLYSRSKVGLNLHIDEQLKWANELNERTYTLAACGIPQLVDRPKLLIQRFPAEALFVADTPSEYYHLFHEIIRNPQEAAKRSALALEVVYEKHTTFHRIDAFLHDLFNSSPAHSPISTKSILD